MERAVPATWAFAASRSLALRSGILMWAILVTWASVRVPDDFFAGRLGDPWRGPAPGG